MITARSLAQLHELRTEVGRLTDESVRTVAEAWLAAWEKLSPAWQAALAAVVDAAARTGRWPSSWQLARIPEVASAATATDRAGVALGAATGTAVAAAVGGIVAATIVAEPLILAAQLPAVLAITAASGFAAKVQASTVHATQVSLTRRVHDATRVLGADVSAAVGRALVRGLPAGTPLGAAGLLDRLGAAWSQTAARATATAQTETLDAYRATAGLVHAANADVVQGWLWIADLGPRCCIACWAMHKTWHPNGEPGPLGHTACRCGRLPQLRPWRQLGITGDEPADAVPDAEARFRKLTRADQIRIMGRARLQMLDDGAAEWGSLATRRTNPRWRDSYVPTSITKLQRLAGYRID